MQKLFILLLLLLAPLANASELHCLTFAMYKEARGEGKTGMLLVGNVILNRVESKLFPNSICKVIKQKGQFDFRYNSKYKLENKYYSLATVVINRSKDITYGSLYFTTKKKRLKNKKIKLKYKNHLFY